MSLEARYADRVFDRYEHKFLDCMMVLIVSHLAMRGTPVEWLFCDALEDVDRIADHCLRRHRRWWEYDGNLSPVSLPLVGARIRTMTFANYRQAQPAVLEELDHGRLVLFRVDTYYQPNRPNYRTEHRQGHTVALRDYERQEGTIRYLALDDLDMRALSKVFADEAVVTEMFDHSEFRDIYVLEEGHQDTEAIDLEAVIGRYRRALAKAGKEPRAAMMLRDYLDAGSRQHRHAPEVRYQQASDAFKLLAGSRELLAAYMRRLSENGTAERADAARLAEERLLAAAGAAERLYLALLKASLTGQLSRTLPADIAHYFELEQAALSAAAADPLLR